MPPEISVYFAIFAWYFSILLLFFNKPNILHKIPCCIEIESKWTILIELFIAAGHHYLWNAPEHSVLVQSIHQGLIYW